MTFDEIKTFCANLMMEVSVKDMLKMIAVIDAAKHLHVHASIEHDPEVVKLREKLLELEKE